MMAWNTAMRMQQVRRTFLDGSSMSTGSVSSTRYVSATPRTRTTLGMKWKVNAAGVGSGCVAKWWKSAVMLPAPPPTHRRVQEEGGRQSAERCRRSVFRSITRID